MRKKLVFAVVLVIAAMTLAVPAYAVQVEQSQAYMPEIDVYLYDNNDEGLGRVRPEDITASLDGKLLQIDNFGPAASLSKGTCYYYLLDISRSISDYDFAAVKQAILDAHTRLKPQDQLVLITFGDAVSTVLRGGESRTEVENALKTISPHDMTTALYAALQRALELAPAKVQAGLRNIIIVATDGADETEAGVTLSEIRAKTQYSGLSLFALCTKNSTQAKRDSLGGLARDLGGDLYLFDGSNAKEQLAKIMDRLEGSMLLRMKADSNLADGGTHELNLMLGNLSTVSTKVTTAFWEPDMTAPQLLDAAYQGAGGAIRLQFSEAVEQIDALSNYELVSKTGTRVGIAAASYADGSGTAVDIFPGSDPYEGSYTLTVSNLTDRSMEHNPLAETSRELFLRTGVFPPPEPTPEPPPPPEEPRSLWWVYVLVALAVVIFVISFIRYKLKQEMRANEEKAAKARQRSGGRTGLADIVPVAAGPEITLLVSEPGSSRTVKLNLSVRPTLGRDDGCQLQLSDIKVSRRHCMLFNENGNVILEDLGSSNGTNHNGNAVRSREVVNPGDVITIGDTELRVLDIQSGNGTAGLR
jgi:hypothetical protein